MNTNEALKQFENNDFLNQIYQFSYKRCSTGTEAEDLCSEIILSVLSAIQKQTNILEFHAFVWTIAHRVYADYCAKRSKNSICISLENTNQSLMSRKNEIDDLKKGGQGFCIKTPPCPLKIVIFGILLLYVTFDVVHFLFHFYSLRLTPFAIELHSIFSI